MGGELSISEKFREPRIRRSFHETASKHDLVSSGAVADWIIHEMVATASDEELQFVFISVEIFAVGNLRSFSLGVLRGGFLVKGGDRRGGNESRDTGCGRCCSGVGVVKHPLIVLILSGGS